MELLKRAQLTVRAVQNMINTQRISPAFFTREFSLSPHWRPLSPGGDENSNSKICIHCGKFLWFGGMVLLCPVCDQIYCSKCYGRNIFTKCISDSGCMKCAKIVRQQEIFHRYCISFLEKGVTCFLYMNGGGSENVQYTAPMMHVWMVYDVDTARIRWRTVQLSNNCPLASGALPMSKIKQIESGTPTTLSVFHGLRDLVSPLIFQMTTPNEARSWRDSLHLAWLLMGFEQLSDTDDTMDDMQTHNEYETGFEMQNIDMSNIEMSQNIEMPLNRETSLEPIMENEER
eukprot:GHVO01022800.1.p1 GENE.GHVO01022800.1~~GHVO01022800.1.p1  ORF type:complete len:287 (+),score=62.85 GHVO01022800.1:42-902(+)